MSGHFDKSFWPKLNEDVRHSKEKETAQRSKDLTEFFNDAVPSEEDVAAYFKAIDARVSVDPTNAVGGKKFDGGKLDYTLLPFNALEDVVKVLGFGMVKYGRDNWQMVERQRYIAAAFRHLVEIAKGNKFDDESGMSHAAHLTCCSLFLGEHQNAK